MIVVLCPQCSLALRVIGDLAEVHSLVGEHSEFWPDNYTCPRCAFKHARGSIEQALSPEFLSSYEMRDLGAAELFSALMGLGLPDEGSCQLVTVTELLTTKRVKRVVGIDVPGVERCVLDYIELDDGTRLHFGAGPDGAVIYRNVPPQSYAEKVHD